MNSGTAERCPFCGVTVALDMAHECIVTNETYAKVLAGKPLRVRDIAPGGVFVTVTGEMVVKSEYRLRPTDPASPAMCIIIGSGEYFHGEKQGVHGDDAPAWPLSLGALTNKAPEKQMALLRHALHEIVTASFAWEDSTPVNSEMERKRWLKMRNIAMNGLQNAEAER